MPLFSSFLSFKLTKSRGIGFYFGKAIAVRDFGLLTGLFSLIVIGVIVATFIAEIIYALIDPRVKLK